MPDRKLVQIDPPRLGSIWHKVRPALEKMTSADGWLPEDVYASIKTGGASLLMGTIDGEHVGFFVLRVLSEFDGKRLHIWILHADSKITEPMIEFSNDLDTIARNCQCERITFGSTRKGWEKTAPRYGFVLRECLFERGVS